MIERSGDPHASSAAKGMFSRRTAIRVGGVGVATGLAASIAPRLSAAQDATPAPPTDSAMDDRVAAALDQLDSIVADIMDRTGIPGIAVSVVANDAVVHAKGYGVRDTAGTDPIDEDTRFQIASVSKPFASTVVASVIGDGDITWDTTIQSLTPEFRLYEEWPSKEVTLRDMFCHRSGLPDHAGDLLEDIGYDRETVLHRLRYQRPRSSFRSAYDYTNFGLTAAAVAAASTTGESWEDLSVSRLYEPLGMTRTSSRFDDFFNDENRARTHVQVGDGWEARYVRQPDPESPAGGVSSTARDIAQFMRLHIGAGVFEGEQIVASDPLNETHLPHMMSNHLVDPLTDRPNFYGLGWNVGYTADDQLMLSHSGAFSLGTGTTVFIIPAHGIGISVLTNGYPLGGAEAIALSFLDIVQFGEIRFDFLPIIGSILAAQSAPAYGSGIDYSEPPADPVAALSPEAYVGQYHNDFVGEITIAEGENGFELWAGPEPMVFPLEHYNRDVFWFQPTGENAGPPSAVNFTVNDAGSATTMYIEYFDIHGNGTFDRVLPEPDLPLPE